MINNEGKFNIRDKNLLDKIIANYLSCIEIACFKCLVYTPCRDKLIKEINNKSRMYSTLLQNSDLILNKNIDKYIESELFWLTKNLKMTCPYFAKYENQITINSCDCDTEDLKFIMIFSLIIIFKLQNLFPRFNEAYLYCKDYCV